MKSMKTVMVSVMLLLIMVSIIALITGATEYGGGGIVEVMEGTTVDAGRARRNSTSGPHRKLLIRSYGPSAAPAGAAAAEVAKVQPNRIWGDTCSGADIVINQGPTAPLPSGIPTYTVQIMNVCSTGCNISGIHLTCGWFSSARLINPRLFKRLHYNNCLVNEGKPLLNGRTISFQYANTFPYSLTISSFIC